MNLKIDVMLDFVHTAKLVVHFLTLNDDDNYFRCGFCLNIVWEYHNIDSHMIIHCE